METQIHMEWRAPKVENMLVNIFLIIFNLRDNWAFRTRLMSMNCGVYNTRRSKMYDNNSTKDKKEVNESRLLQVFYLKWWNINSW